MTKKPLPLRLFLIFLLISGASAHAQDIHSLGLFTGISVPYTWDGGINQDSRYRTRFDVKYCPIGFHYGIDREGHGFMFDPGVIKIGQNFNVINTTGGEIGYRNINLTYIQVPVSVKLHIIDMSFFKVSFVASIGAGFLLDGNETIRHSAGKLKFPTEMTGVFPSAKNQEFEAKYPGYIVEYDGVLVPAVDAKLVNKDYFQKIQLFGGIGFRSDWDFAENWRASFDLRANIGILEPRNSDYTGPVKDYNALYDIYGDRRDLFLSLNFGIARTVTIEPREKEAKVKKRMTNKPTKHKYPWPGPRNKSKKNRKG